MFLIKSTSCFCAAGSLECMCLCAWMLCFPPLKLPLPKRSREHGSAEYAVGGVVPYMEIKDNNIPLDAVKFTGR